MSEPTPEVDATHDTSILSASPPPVQATLHLRLLGTGRPTPRVRGDWIKQFPGGKGENNCPRFFYIRDGFGCVFNCKYCYLDRQTFRHVDGAEFNPDFATLDKQVATWLKRPGELGLILGEVTDAWGWAHIPEIRERNLRLIEMFRGQRSHTLICLTKSGRVHQFLEGVTPRIASRLPGASTRLRLPSCTKWGPSRPKIDFAMRVSVGNTGGASDCGWTP